MLRSEKPSSSSQIINFLNSGIEKAKEIIPAVANRFEISVTPRENMNAWATLLCNNPFASLSILAVPVTASFVSDGSRSCFEINNVLYSLGCDKLANGEDIQSDVYGALQQQCAITPAPGKCSNVPFNFYESFGKSYLGGPICSIIFYGQNNFNSCVANVTANNTPAKAWTQGDMGKIALGAVPGFLLALTFTGKCLWKMAHPKPKEQELIPVINEKSMLAP